MRLFVAAVLPDAVLDALAETSALLRGSVRGRFVAPDSFHVTLAFLGDTPAERVDDAAGAIEMACREFSAFGVSLGSLGSFGKRSAATLWQGFGDAGALPEIAAAVRDELRERGFSFDAKSFRAHVTLMRKADLTHGILPMPAQADGDVRSIVLFKSDLSGDRPLYEPLHIVDLP